MHISEVFYGSHQKNNNTDLWDIFQTYVCSAAALRLECFLQRALGLYTPNFLKRCAASFTDLLERPIGLLEHCFCLPELLFSCFEFCCNGNSAE